MKKIILFLLLIFTTIPGFTYDYREILFGNNYENITECTDDEISYGYIYIKLLIHLMKNLWQLP